MQAMKNLLTSLVMVGMLAGCTESPEEQSMPDQCKRVELFQQCLKAIPEGPGTTKYNDWAEVVNECEDHAYYAAKRRASNIKPECRPY